MHIDPNSTHLLAAIDGPALITHIWLTTHPSNWRSLILRAYWDGAGDPAIEVPVGDFFGQGWCEFAQLSSVPVAANPHGGFNSYWPMPVPRHARLTLENRATQTATVYYQISYEIDVDVAGDAVPAQSVPPQQPAGRRHCAPNPRRRAGRREVRRHLPRLGRERTGWWGEGEVKFYLDGDEEFPTICGTGTEDYFGGAWNFDVPGQGYSRLLDAVPRAAPGHPPGRAVPQPAAVRHVPVASARPHPLPPPTCAWTSRPSDGRQGTATGLCTTTSPPPRSSTWTAHRRRARHCPAPTTWRWAASRDLAR